MHSYKILHPSFEKRQKEWLKLRKSYPDLIPLIIETKEGSGLPPINKFCFLVPPEITAHQFCILIRNRMKLDEFTSLYMLVNIRHMVNSNMMMDCLYSSKKDADGFLYITFTQEQSLG